MIAKIKGKLISISESELLLEVSDITYTILLPSILQKKLSSYQGQEITLYTYHYFETEQRSSNLTPRLIGFSEKIEEEFFRKFITVKSIGPKKALKAMSIPIPSIAAAIEKRDAQTLSELPKIGKRTAEQIIAELQGKMAKFGLIKDDQTQKELTPDHLETLKEEAKAVLLQLDYKKAEAVQMINNALRLRKEFKSTEELIQVIYSQANR